LNGLNGLGGIHVEIRCDDGMNGWCSDTAKSNKGSQIGQF
jgi:hypothetical protein